LEFQVEMEVRSVGRQTFPDIIDSLSKNWPDRVTTKVYMFALSCVRRSQRNHSHLLLQVQIPI